MAHSNGCELGLPECLDGARPRRLGIETAASGRYDPRLKRILSEVKPTSHRRQGLARVDLGPNISNPAISQLTSARPAASAGAGISAKWAIRGRFPVLAGQSPVPCDFSAAEHEAVVGNRPPKALLRASPRSFHSPSPSVEVEPAGRVCSPIEPLGWPRRLPTAKRLVNSRSSASG